jgi:hypothetical protein
MKRAVIALTVLLWLYAAPVTLIGVLMYGFSIFDPSSLILVDYSGEDWLIAPLSVLMAWSSIIIPIIWVYLGATKHGTRTN